MAASSPPDSLELQRRRQALTRAYDLTAELRQLHSGYSTTSWLQRQLRQAGIWLEYQFLPHYFGNPPRWRMLLRRLKGPRTLPDFCVVGPFKSGSSDLAVNLCLHPGIMTPLVKEMANPNPQAWRIYYPTEAEKSAHAIRHGAALTPYLAPFLHGMERIYRLSKLRPDARIVLTLREPAARVYSHWKWEYFLAGRQNAEQLPFLRDFSTYVDVALRVFPENLMFTACGMQALHSSIYHHAVEYWIECFGREQVLVLDMAEYWQDRSTTLHRIQDFVGLPPLDVPPSTHTVNENPLRDLPPADPASLQRLREFFRPYNDRLWAAIGTRFDW